MWYLRFSFYPRVYYSSAGGLIDNEGIIYPRVYSSAGGLIDNEGIIFPEDSAAALTWLIIYVINAIYHIAKT